MNAGTYLFVVAFVNFTIRNNNSAAPFTSRSLDWHRSELGFAGQLNRQFSLEAKLYRA